MIMMIMTMLMQIFHGTFNCTANAARGVDDNNDY